MSDESTQKPPRKTEQEKSIEKLKKARDKILTDKKVSVEAATKRAALKFDERLSVINRQLAGLGVAEDAAPTTGFPARNAAAS